MLQAVHGSPVLTGASTPEPGLTSAVARAWAGLGWLGALHTFLLIFCTLSSGVWGGIPRHLSEALVCPPTHRLPKAKFCKEINWNPHATGAWAVLSRG